MYFPVASDANAMLPPARGGLRGEEPRLQPVQQVVRPEGHAEGAPQGPRRHPGLPVRRVRKRSGSLLEKFT